MADPIPLAQELWDACQTDASLLAALETELGTMILGIAQGNITGDVVNASKNGASYTMRPGYTLQDRLTAIRLAVRGVKSKIRPSRVTRVLWS